MWAHRLTADMEADAKAIGGLTRGHQKLGCFMRLRAELGGKAQLRMVARHADTHEQIEVCRMVGGAQDFLQLFMAVEREGAHAMLCVCLCDSALGFDRMHEAQLGLRERRTNGTHLGDGRDVEMRHASAPQGAQQCRRWIGLDRVERLAAEIIHEKTRRALRRMRADQRHGFVRRSCLDYSESVRKIVQFKGPPKDFVSVLSCLAVWKSPWGSGRAIYGCAEAL